jgi:parallel beta-helix repeat protein
VANGLASGIYSDGGVRNVVFANVIEGNSKEGLCLDDGSAANVVISNTIHDNGGRWGDPDWVLAEDSILVGGRLPNGTAAEKVPGISLDNAIYNIVFENDLAHNFGGGVKVVRTGYFNVVGLNTILDDNDGASAAFHFFGIELGAAGGSSSELDFTPSRGNMVVSNTVRGAHYSGICFDAGSDTNTVIYNVILDATSWALESAAPMSNTAANNLTNLPSRNITAN